MEFDSSPYSWYFEQMKSCLSTILIMSISVVGLAQDCDSFDIEWGNVAGYFCASAGYAIEVVITGDDQPYDVEIIKDGAVLMWESVDGPGTYGLVTYFGGGSINDSPQISATVSIDNLGPGPGYCPKTITKNPLLDWGPWYANSVPPCLGGDNSIIEYSNVTADEIANNYTLNWSGGDPGDYTIEPLGNSGALIVGADPGIYELDFIPIDNQGTPPLYCVNHQNVFVYISAYQAVQYSWELLNPVDANNENASVSIDINGSWMSYDYGPFLIEGEGVSETFDEIISLDGLNSGSNLFVVSTAEGCNGNILIAIDDCEGALGCTDSSAVNFNPTAQCNDGSCIIYGCTVTSSCNYDSSANEDDGSCILPECTDPAAINYDPTPECLGPCEYGVDIDEDGIVDTGDLLLMLASLGCIGDCAADINGDYLVNVADVLFWIALFGEYL
jgi:hypothetical protein